jgi:cyclase
MLTKRIIPCLDVKKGHVVKGIKFQNHKIMGDPVELAIKYSDQNADELVFYDIYSSVEDSSVPSSWIENIAKNIDIPFCVAGGIKSLSKASQILNIGADKISINTPALENPSLINELAKAHGSQCVVIGIDSFFNGSDYFVYARTGSEKSKYHTGKKTVDWLQEAQDRGAGEIVLNCMNQDGVREGYDIEQLEIMKNLCKVPLIASGGAGCKGDFKDVFLKCDVDGALAASVFHNNEIKIMDLKRDLICEKIPVRL